MRDEEELMAERLDNRAVTTHRRQGHGADRTRDKEW